MTERQTRAQGRRAATGRDGEGRTYEERPKIQRWRPPNQLNMPTRKNGLGFYYAREAANGEPDMGNMDFWIEQGMRPATIDDVGPEWAHKVKPDGYIRTGGLILICAPVEFWEQRTAYYQRKMDAQLSSADTLQGLRKQAKDSAFSLEYQDRRTGKVVEDKGDYG